MTDSRDQLRTLPATHIMPDHARDDRQDSPAITFPPSRQPRSRLAWILALATLLLLIGTGLWYYWSSGPPPIHYKTAVVDRGPITAIVTATGTVNPVISVQVGSQVSGKIAQLFADFNSVVKKGQVLAKIDQSPFQARVSQARAAVKSARGNLAKGKNMARQRKLELDRMAALRPQAFVSQADVDLATTTYRDATANVEVLQAQLDQAQATLASAELDLGYTTIRSPVNGIVVSRNVDVGQTIAAAFQTPILFVIAQDLTQMQVNTNVSESDIGGVAKGSTATFRVDAYPKHVFNGTVAQVRNAPINIQNVVTYDVVITVNNRDLKLKPGMTANVTIVTAREENPLRVPNGALRFRMPEAPVDRSRTRVWVLKSDGPTSRTVVAGIADSLFTEIVEGPLTVGETVIVGIEPAEDQASRSLPPGFIGGRR